jgi:hypothetical protein
MIQFNLLPDVKLEYIKARQTKRMVILVSAVVTAASFAIVVVLFLGVNVVQKNHLKNLQSDIDRDSKSLQDVPDLNKILTVQNQLNSLDELHAGKPAVERMGKYLAQVVPKNVTVSSLDVSLTEHTMSFEGSATALSEINRFIDTLKFTKYEAGDKNGNAFSAVVLATFGRTDSGMPGENTQPATYQVTLTFDPAIFDNSLAVSLKVPDTVTTRSATEKPDSIFQPQGSIDNPASGAETEGQ